MRSIDAWNTSGSNCVGVAAGKDELHAVAIEFAIRQT